MTPRFEPSTLQRNPGLGKFWWVMIKVMMVESITYKMVRRTEDRVPLTPLSSSMHHSRKELRWKPTPSQSKRNAARASTTE